jgi:hypothetical protein
VVVHAVNGRQVGDVGNQGLVAIESVYGAGRRELVGRVADRICVGAVDNRGLVASDSTSDSITSG